jgi:hypothetical protein
MPLPEAYQEAKRRHPDMLLLFSERHSYWAYGADAEAAKRVGGAAVGFHPATGSAPALGVLGALAPREDGRCPPAVHVLDLGNNCYRAEVTDGRRLLIVRGKCRSDEGAGIDPAPPAGELLIHATDWHAGFKLARKGQQAVALAADGAGFVLQAGGKEVRGQQLGGRFPPADVVLPKRGALVSVRVNAQLLAELLQVAVAALGPDGTSVDLLFYGRDQPLGVAGRTEHDYLDALIAPVT